MPGITAATPIPAEKKLTETVFGTDIILSHSKCRDMESANAILDFIFDELADSVEGFTRKDDSIIYTAYTKADEDTKIEDLDLKKKEFTVAYINEDDDIVLQETGFIFIDTPVKEALESSSILNIDIDEKVTTYVTAKYEAELARREEEEEAKRVEAITTHNSLVTTSFDSITQFSTTRKFTGEVQKILANYEGLIDIVSVEEVVEENDMFELTTTVKVTDVEVCKVDRNKVTYIDNDLNINFVDALKSEFLIVNTQGNSYFLQERV